MHKIIFFLPHGPDNLWALKYFKALTVDRRFSLIQRDLIVCPGPFQISCVYCNETHQGVSGVRDRP